MLKRRGMGQRLVISNRPVAGPPGDLAVTWRALRDLGIPAGVISSVGLDRRDPADLVQEHPVLADFVRQRSVSSEGQEPTLGVSPTTWNLHTGPWRSVTWYDAAQDVCWLLACSATHDYDEFVARSRSGTLLPSAADWAAFGDRFVPRDDFLDLALPQAEELLQLAQEQPGVEHRLTLGAEVDMGLYREVLHDGRSRLWIRYKVPPRHAKDLPGDLAEVLAGLFFEDDLNVNWWATEHPAYSGRLAQEDAVMHYTDPQPAEVDLRSTLSQIGQAVGMDATHELD
jgi:hypothetical protein